MSIIGTRPPLISETNLYELHHRATEIALPFGSQEKENGQSNDLVQKYRDILKFAVGIIMGIVLYLIARFQHRYNMPSFRDPQFERIRKYLENDEL